MKHRENYPSWDAIEDVLAEDSNSGFCLSCGTDIDGGIEPDAQKYKCPVCDEMEVYGAEAIMLMGAYK
jgi:predicted RNA-binding Zn-ribbon protein involved in translation (DUF1610 family)